LSEHNNHPELVRQAGAEALVGRMFTRLLIAEPGQLLEAFCY
jgi:hypothetical protein